MDKRKSIPSSCHALKKLSRLSTLSVLVSFTGLVTVPNPALAAESVQTEVKNIELIPGYPIRIVKEFPNGLVEIIYKGNTVKLPKKGFDLKNDEVKDAISQIKVMAEKDPEFRAVQDRYEKNLMFTMGVFGHLALHHIHERAFDDKVDATPSTVIPVGLQFFNFFYDPSMRQVSEIVYHGQKELNEFLDKRWRAIGFSNVKINPKPGKEKEAALEFNKIVQNLAQELREADQNQKPFLHKVKTANLDFDLTGVTNITKDHLLLVPYGLEYENPSSRMVYGVLTLVFLKPTGDIVYQAASYYEPTKGAGAAQKKVEKLVHALEAFVRSSNKSTGQSKKST